MKKKIQTTITILLMLLILSACSGRTAQAVTKTGFAFDTVISITIYDSQKSGVLDECIAMCEQYDELFSATNEGSEIWRLNHSGGEPVSISYETASLLQSALYWCELSGGTLDLTMLPISEAWDITGQMELASENPDYEYVIPDADTLGALLSHVDYRNVVIYGKNGNAIGYDEEISPDIQYSAAILDAQATVDLGFIAKGYIADRLKEYMLSEGIESGIISLGGNILLIGQKPDGASFNIGLQKPFADTGETIYTISATDISIVSSGCYERYFTADDGTICHHIFDSATGEPVQNELLGVTVLSSSSLECDALSTYCYILGLEQGSKLVGSLDGVDAVFVTKDYDVIDTRNF